MNNQNMMCDLETGVCGVVDEDPIEQFDLDQQIKKITLYYVTDPICSHCWALEPVLNRFLQQYGQYFNVNVIMGGLLASWHGFGDSANGIQKPSDVEEHWKEVGKHSRMPIDGTLWRENPVHSSYPPSRVYKVIQNKHKGKENEFLRRAREAVFAFNQNIGEKQVLIEIVNQIGLNGSQVFEESELEEAQNQLEQDFDLVSRLGVRGFPTIIMVDEEGKGAKIVGARTLETYVDALEQILNDRIKPKQVKPLTKLMKESPLLFSKEIEVMYGVESSEVEKFITAELSEGSYQIKHILGELYVVAQKNDLPANGRAQV
ncbi:DsbA family oxidoreductase [Paenibacillus periandrae]|uniref:DsbA family oxidoreductase n=1 Tax=Paenibacillus periandrae TaxID=1761741 RepID=UPI001F093F57|nr:DsbA family protein [Paenibacillus periandrae]